MQTRIVSKMPGFGFIVLHHHVTLPLSLINLDLDHDELGGTAGHSSGDIW